MASRPPRQAQPLGHLSVGCEVRGRMAEGRGDGAGKDDQNQRVPTRLGPHPKTERSADGAMLCGMLEMKTAAKKLTLIGKAVPIWIPKMIDSGTRRRRSRRRCPSPAHPRLAEARLHEACRRRGRRRHRPASTTTNCQRASRLRFRATRSKEMAASSAPAPNPARMPTRRAGPWSQKAGRPASRSDDADQCGAECLEHGGSSGAVRPLSTSSIRSAVHGDDTHPEPAEGSELERACHSSPRTRTLPDGASASVTSPVAPTRFSTPV